MYNTIGLVNERNELTDDNQTAWWNMIRQDVQDVGFLPDNIGDDYTIEENAHDVAEYLAENLEIFNEGEPVEISEAIRKTYRENIETELLKSFRAWMEETSS